MSTLDKVREVISQEAYELPMERVAADTTLRWLYVDGHLDSLKIIEILLALEEMFEIDIPDEHAASFETGDKTVADIVLYLDRRVANKAGQQ